MKIVPGDLLIQISSDGAREAALYFVIAATEFDVFYYTNHLDRCERSYFHRWAKNYTERLNERL